MLGRLVPRHFESNRDYNNSGSAYEERFTVFVF